MDVVKIAALGLMAVAAGLFLPGEAGVCRTSPGSGTSDLDLRCGKTGSHLCDDPSD